jgi:hypothetical protein
MEKKQFKILINAPREKVWEKLWNDASYREWTSVFAEGSSAETDWNEGSRVLFGDGKGNGMVSRIASKKTNEVMSFEHLGMLKDGVEDLSSDEVKQWSGAKENYYLRQENGKTELVVEIDLAEDFTAYFEEKFPVALKKVKELAES